MTKKYDIVVPISGGKDSQACLKLAGETGKNVVGMFCDTQFEHPKTYEHIKKIGDLYDIKIETITGGSVEDKILKYQRFPGGGARFCTDELKIREGKLFYKKLAEEQGHGFEVWYGVRSDESPERTKRYRGKVSDKLYDPHDYMKSKYPQYLAKLGIQIRLPIIDWSTDEVFDYLDGEENPLYNEGFERVGCFPCLASGDAWKNKAFTHDDFGKQQKELIDKLSPIIGKSIWTSKHGQSKYDKDSGCSFCSI